MSTRICKTPGDVVTFVDEVQGRARKRITRPEDARAMCAKLDQLPVGVVRLVENNSVSQCAGWSYTATITSIQRTLDGYQVDCARGLFSGAAYRWYAYVVLPEAVDIKYVTHRSKGVASLDDVQSRATALSSL